MDWEELRLAVYRAFAGGRRPPDVEGLARRSVVSEDDEQRADPADDLVHRRIGSEELGQPGHVTVRSGNEPVKGMVAECSRLAMLRPPSTCALSFRRWTAQHLIARR